MLKLSLPVDRVLALKTKWFSTCMSKGMEGMCNFCVAEVEEDGRVYMFGEPAIHIQSGRIDVQNN